MMTNGTVGTVTSVSSGREMEVSYPNGSRHIVVPPDVPIVLITLGGDRSLVKPGVPVFMAAATEADGSLAANNISVGRTAPRRRCSGGPRGLKFA